MFSANAAPLDAGTRLVSHRSSQLSYGTSASAASPARTRASLSSPGGGGSWRGFAVPPAVQLPNTLESMRLFPEWRREQRRQGRTWGTNESYRARGRRRMGNSQDAWRLIDRNGAFNQAGGNVRVVRAHRSRALYLNDLFHTLVNAGMGTVLAVFSGGYLLTILVFALAFLVLSSRCALGLDTFVGAWAFSVETIMTIGYGFPGSVDFIHQCGAVLALVTIETICGVLLNALAVGLVYARFARGQSRACTIVFSDFACVRRIDGKLVFMVKVAEMRKHQLVEPHVRMYAVCRTTGDGGAPGALNSVQRTPVFVRTDAMRVDRPDETLGGMLLMCLPSVVIHAIDLASPLLPRAMQHAHALTPRASAKGSGSGALSGLALGSEGSHLPDSPRSTSSPRPLSPLPFPDADEHRGEIDAAAEEQAIKEYLENYRVEVIVMVEGTDSVTSDSIQARHSYCAHDIMWHHDFVPCTLERPGGTVAIDFAHFHDVFPLATARGALGQGARRASHDFSALAS